MTSGTATTATVTSTSAGTTSSRKSPPRLKTIAAAGVEPFKLRDLRHFYASNLIAAGCDVVTVQRALEHRSALVTLNTYSHLWPNAEDRTRSATAGLMRAVTGGPADSLRTEGTDSR
nr:tyrosine-type recombinase/integrase [Curtobacterium sp. PhB191]